MNKKPCCDLASNEFRVCICHDEETGKYCAKVFCGPEADECVAKVCSEKKGVIVVKSNAVSGEICVKNCGDKEGKLVKIEKICDDSAKTLYSLIINDKCCMAVVCNKEDKVCAFKLCSGEEALKRMNILIDRQRSAQGKVEKCPDEFFKEGNCTWIKVCCCAKSGLCKIKTICGKGSENCSCSEFTIDHTEKTCCVCIGCEKSGKCCVKVCHKGECMEEMTCDKAKEKCWGKNPKEKEVSPKEDQSFVNVPDKH